MTTNTHITQDIETAAGKIVSASGTMRERRMGMGAALKAAGFKPGDFTKAEAEAAGRVEYFRAAQDIAVLLFPGPIQNALKDKRVKGSDLVSSGNKLGDVTRKKTEWSTQKPGKVRDLGNMLVDFLVATGELAAPDNTRGANGKKFPETMFDALEKYAARLAKDDSDEAFPALGNSEAATALVALVKAMRASTHEAAVKALRDAATKLGK